MALTRAPVRTFFSASSSPMSATRVSCTSARAPAPSGLPGVFRGRRDLEPECIDALGAFAAEGPELVGVEGALGLAEQLGEVPEVGEVIGALRTKWLIAHAAMVGLRSAPICFARSASPASLASATSSGGAG